MNTKQENNDKPKSIGKISGSNHSGSGRRALTIFLMWLFILLGFVLGGLIAIQVALYIAGDANFINSLIYQEDIESRYHKLGFVALFVGGLAGAAVGGLLWYHIIRKTGLITSEELDRML